MHAIPETTSLQSTYTHHHWNIHTLLPCIDLHNCCYKYASNVGMHRMLVCNLTWHNYTHSAWHNDATTVNINVCYAAPIYFNHGACTNQYAMHVVCKDAKTRSTNHTNITQTPTVYGSCYYLCNLYFKCVNMCHAMDNPNMHNGMFLDFFELWAHLKTSLRIVMKHISAIVPLNMYYFVVSALIGNAWLWSTMHSRSQHITQCI